MKIRVFVTIDKTEFDFNNDTVSASVFAEQALKHCDDIYTVAIKYYRDFTRDEEECTSENA